jgi:hypothetical protein
MLFMAGSRVLVIRPVPAKRAQAPARGPLGEITLKAGRKEQAKFRPIASWSLPRCRKSWCQSPKATTSWVGAGIFRYFKDLERQTIAGDAKSGVWN